jgi:hypothetical protein
MLRKLKIFTFLTCTLFSCQKENNIDNGTTPTPSPTPVIDTSIISKIIGFDTTKSMPFDTTYTLTYQYDNLKRVSKIIFLYYGNSGSFDLLNNESEIQTNNYLGSDTLPYQTVTTYTSVNSEYKQTQYFLYTNNSILSYDSSIFLQTLPTLGAEEIQSNNFTNTTNQCIQITNNYFNSLIDTTIHNTTTQNGNILYQKTTYSDLSTNILTLSYDTMINPFKKLNTWINQFPNFLYGQNWIFSRGIINSHRTKNNIKSVIFTNVNGSGQNFQCDYVYKYNNSNYPIEMIYTNMVNGSYLRPSLNKLKFFYR